jgi:hypothetical protein
VNNAGRHYQDTNSKEESDAQSQKESCEKESRLRVEDQERKEVQTDGLAAGEILSPSQEIKAI